MNSAIKKIVAHLCEEPRPVEGKEGFFGGKLAFVPTTKISQAAVDEFNRSRKDRGSYKVELVGDAIVVSARTSLHTIPKNYKEFNALFTELLRDEDYVNDGLEKVRKEKEDFVKRMASNLSVDESDIEWKPKVAGTISAADIHSPDSPNLFGGPLVQF